MRWLLTATLLVGLTACQCVARVTVSGSLEQGVLFQAPGGPSDSIGQGELHELTVHMVGSNALSPIWRIKGRARIGSLVYGRVPSGLSEDAPAKPLERGRTYIVEIDGANGGFTPPCHGAVSFAIGPDGRITSCYEGGSECA